MGLSSKATTAVKSWMALCVLACSPQAAGDPRVPDLSTVDALGMGVAQVMGWCANAGADKSLLTEARDAYVRNDYATAVAILTKLTKALKEQGADIPDEAFVILKLAEGALAAQAAGNGLGVFK